MTELKHFKNIPSDHWKAEGFESAEKYNAFLARIEARVDSMPRQKVRYETVERYLKEPYAKTTSIKRTVFSGDPQLIVVEGHEMDSGWDYPDVNETYLSGSNLSGDRDISKAEYQSGIAI